MTITTILTAVLAVSFLHPFAPSEGYVNVTEKPFREEVCLNGSWDISFRDGVWEDVAIKIPSPWNVNAFGNNGLEGPDHRNYPSYPDSWVRELQARMRKVVTVPASWAGKRIKLHFEAVAGHTDVYANGVKVAENFDIFLPFEADITDVARPGESVEILVDVKSQKLYEDNSTVGRRIVPAGSMWGYLINGIWQDVYLLAVPQVSIENVYVKPLVSQGRLVVEATVRNDSGAPQRLKLGGTVDEWINKAGKDILSAPVPAWKLGGRALTLAPKAVEVPAGETMVIELEAAVSEGELEYWTPETPNLYGLQLQLCDKSGKRTLDRKWERFGWREWTLVGSDQCLNGKPYRLRGDSWHFMGVPQLTRRYAWSWFTAIKGMNGNAVRPHAQVYPRFYLDMADEMGICVLDETANWASDGGPKLDSDAFWDASRDHLRRMVMRDRNHASVFGWSVSNENKPVILYVHKRPDLMPLQEQAWKDWVDIVRETDTTRPWISSDGEDDGNGILPVTVGHYGDEGSMRWWKSIGKPWGVGEHGMAYYGTPREVSKYNGERAYESCEGRMEGIAAESYMLIRSMREAGASYSTVFNMAWYSLKPLPLGKKDIEASPSLEDGIRFDDFVEGVPGVQPERMGPYCTTFNPGYDPALPLFDPWPMYEAMRAANAPDGAQWCRWAELPQTAGPVETPCVIPYDKVYYIGRDDSAMGQLLSRAGVVLSKYDEKIFRRSSDRAVFLVDGSEPQQMPYTGSADVVLWGLTPESAPAFASLLPEPIELVPLKRSSFLPARKSFMSALQNSDFYFCEVQKEDASRFSISGRFASEGEVLLEACRTDWRKWNWRPEELKTAAVLRSENECVAPLAVIARYGNIYVSTLENFVGSAKGATTFGKLLYGAGIPFTLAAEGRDAAQVLENLPGLLTKPVN